MAEGALAEAPLLLEGDEIGIVEEGFVEVEATAGRQADRLRRGHLSAPATAGCASLSPTTSPGGRKTGRTPRPRSPSNTARARVAGCSPDSDPPPSPRRPPSRRTSCSDSR